MTGAVPAAPDAAGVAAGMTPAGPSVAVSQDAVPGAPTVDTAARATGTGEPVGRVESAQGDARAAQAAAAAPGEAAR